MFSIEKKNGVIIVDNRVFNSIRDVLNHYGVNEKTALRLLDTGLSLNEILIRNKHSKTTVSAFDSLARGLKNPVLFGTTNKKLPIEKEDTLVSKKFNALKEKYAFMAKQLNKLHKLCDERAKGLSTKAPVCIVYNSLTKTHKDIESACISRWEKLNRTATTKVCNIDDVISGGVVEATTMLSLSMLEDVRNSDFLIIHMPSRQIAETTKTSLGILLRQRANLNRMTLILTSFDYYFSLLEYPQFLKESFSEYGRELNIIDANPSMSL